MISLSADLKGRTATGCRKLTILLGLMLWTAMPVTGLASDVEINTREGFKETEYCLEADQCRYCWTTFQTELNQGIYQSRIRCRRALEDQLPHLERLLARIDEAEAKRPSFHTLYWGGLATGEERGNSQMSMRLALAAFKSPGWDKAKGQPVTGHANPYVRELANTAMIYPELQRLFQATGRQVKVSGVEKVLVMPAVKLPFYDRLKAHGVQPDHRLPYDGLTWFGISAK